MDDDFEKLSDEDFQALLDNNAGRRRKGPDGEYVVMKLEPFRHFVDVMLNLSRGDQKLIAALIDQEGGALMIHPRFLKGARARGLHMVTDEETGVMTVTHLSPR